MPAFASDAPPSNAFLQSEPAQRQFLLKSSRAIAPGVLLGRTKVCLTPLLYLPGFARSTFRLAGALFRALHPDSCLATSAHMRTRRNYAIIDLAAKLEHGCSGHNRHGDHDWCRATERPNACGGAHRGSRCYAVFYSDRDFDREIQVRCTTAVSLIESL